MRLKKYYFVIFVMALMLSSCSKEELMELNETNACETETFSFAQTDIVDKSTLAEVIKGHLKRQRKINEVLPYKISTIKDASGDVYMYVVNFCKNKGYVIISAKKNYNPIIAYSENGNFQVGLNFNLGIELWKMRTISDMQRVDTLDKKILKKYQPIWRAYCNEDNK